MRAEESKGIAEDPLVENGKISALLRSHDWSQTPLGAVETWPESLKTAVQSRLAELNQAQRPEQMQQALALPLQNCTQTATLRQATQADAFRGTLSDALRSLTDVNEIQATAARILGEHLGASRVIYAEVLPGGKDVIVHKNYTNGVAELSGQYHLDEFGRNLTDDHRAGQTAIVPDVANSLKYTDREKAMYRAINIAAHLDVPLIKEDQFVALLAVHQTTPRQWTEREVKWVEETAEQTWATVERARAEAALRESEAKYRMLFESIDEGFCICEMLFDEHGEPIDYRFLEVNSAFEQLTGLEQATGKRMRELVPNHDAYWFEIHGRVVQTRESVRFENYASALNRWFSVNTFCIGEPQNSQFAILFTNITEAKRVEAERKQAEVALRQAEEHYRMLFESIDEGFCTIEVLFDVDGKPVDHCILQANPAFEWQSGIANPEGKRASELAPGVEQYWNDLYAQVIHTGESIRTEVRSDALDRWFDVLVSQIGDPAMRQVAVVFTDISDRKQAEAALQKSEELKRRILESSQDCIKVLSLEGRLLYVNTGGLNLLELDDSASILKAQWLDFWQDEDRLSAEAALAAAKAGNAGQLQGCCPTAKGNLKWWDVIVTPIRDASGMVIQLLSISRDITKQKQAESELEQLLRREQVAREEAERANRIKDEFLAVLSHELRSPLNPILGWTRLLRNGTLNSARQMDALATIERNAKIQSQLIEDLLDISRIMQGKLTLTPTPTNLAFVISAAVETVRLAAEAKQIEIALDLDPGVAPILGDAGRLQQVIWNLLTNAVKFTPTGGQVMVQLSQRDQWAQIRVVDTGIGINAQFLPYVFEYFRQEDGSTTRNFGGLGLGLAIVRQIVELHGGTVKAESAGEHQGATFIVQLPAMQQVTPTIAESTHPQLDSETLLDKVHILLVDDDTDTREFEAFLLEQHGAKVTTVASGLEALQALEQLMPDVIVSDIGMAGMDGYSLMQQIRSRPPTEGGTIPAIALTAYAAEIDQKKALQSGFQKHLTKPLEPEQFVSAIVTLLNSN
jgi:PAS domain S-box-containing protein